MKTALPAAEYSVREKKHLKISIVKQFATAIKFHKRLCTGGEPKSDLPSAISMGKDRDRLHGEEAVDVQVPAPGADRNGG